MLLLDNILDALKLLQTSLESLQELLKDLSTRLAQNDPVIDKACVAAIISKYLEIASIEHLDLQINEIMAELTTCLKD